MYEYLDRGFLIIKFTHGLLGIKRGGRLMAFTHLTHINGYLDIKVSFSIHLKYFGDQSHLIYQASWWETMDKRQCKWHLGKGPQTSFSTLYKGVETDEWSLSSE